MTTCFPVTAHLDEASPAEPLIFDTDPRGEASPSETTTLSGSSMEYTPYGQQWIDEGTDKSIITYRFTSKEYDSETGLYYYGVRYLDPVSARWMTPDPAFGSYLPATPTSDPVRKQNMILPGEGGVFNFLNLDPYAYAGNNPVRYFDPSGSIHMDISDQGVRFIATHESWTPKVYPDIAGNPTIGYGHEVQPGEDFSKGITHAQALALFKADLGKFVNAVNGAINVKLKQSQFDALVSLAFNIGPAGFKGSDVAKDVNANAPQSTLSANWASWNKYFNKKAGKLEVSPGLSARREDEIRLFKTGKYEK